MILLRQLSLARGARRLIENADLQVHAGWRVGLVGANGSGKSSLFALLSGELHPESGDCEVPRDWRIATVDQETPALAQAAIDYVLDGDVELRDIERRLAAADRAHDGHALADLHARLEVTIAHGGILRETRDEKHLQCGSEISRGIRDLTLLNTPPAERHVRPGIPHPRA